jgi:RNA polymerase sigma-70 factor, ECF subfamily
MAASCAPIDDTRWDWSAIRFHCRREALRIVHDPSDADEVVQEALARAWRHHRTPITAPVGWCLHITRNEAFRLLAKRRARAQAEAIIMAEPQAEGADLCDATVDRIALRDALESLRPDDRALIELRYSADLTQPDVARLMGIPEGTVKVRLHRVRQHLRAALESAT